MYQQSGKDNLSSDSRGAEAGDEVDLDLDLDAALLSDISLPTFLSELTDERTDGDESLGALTRSLPDRASRNAGDSAVCSDAPVAQAEHRAPPSYYEATLAPLLASFPAAQDGMSSVPTSVASSLRLRREANAVLVDSDTAAGVGDGVGHVGMAIDQHVSRTGGAGPSQPVDSGDDVGRRIARLIRIVASVASRAVELDESHRPDPDTTEYDARYLLVAVYRIFLTSGSDAGPMKLPKATFSKLAGGIRGDRFASWDRHFQGGRDAALLSEAMAFWSGLGIGQRRDAQAALDQLAALANDGAPPPGLQDLAASPLYQRLSLLKLSGSTSAQLRKARQSWHDNTSDDSATHSGPSSMSARPQGTVRSNVGAAIDPGSAALPGARRPAETREEAAERIARLIRMVASVATHAVALDESHRPIAGQPEYDSRALLAAAYKALSRSTHKPKAEGDFSMSNFSRVAGMDRPKRFMTWNDEFKTKLAAPSAFWASLGLTAGSDRLATMRALKALQNGAEPAPTLRDIAASPLYRKLYINRRYGVNAVPIHWAKRARSVNVPSENGSLAVVPPSASVAPRNALGVASQALRDAASSAESATQALADGAPMQDDPAQQIARLMRLAWRVASGELVPDVSGTAPANGERYDPRGVLAAAYTRLSKGAGKTGSKPNLSISRFSGLVGADQGQRLIRWTREFAGRLDEPNALWASLGLREDSDTNATLRALVTMRDRGEAVPTMRDFAASALYGRLSLVKQTGVYVAPRRQAKRRHTEGTSEDHAQRVSRRRSRASTSTSATASATVSTPTSTPTSTLASTDVSAAPQTPLQALLPVLRHPPLAPAGGAEAARSWRDSAAAPAAALPDWPYDLAPWSQAPVATAVLEVPTVAGPSWSDEALHWLHSGMHTPTPHAATTAQATGDVDATLAPGEAAGVDAALLPDWPFDDVAWPQMALPFAASGTDSLATATSQSRPEASPHVAVPMLFDGMPPRPASNASASDYAPSTVSHSTHSTTGTLPSMTTIASGPMTVPPAMAVPPGTFVFEHGLTRITGGPGVDMALVMEMVRAALAAPQSAPQPPSGANPP